MFPNLFAEIKKIADNFIFIKREEKAARGEARGGEPIFRMIEAERVHLNLLSVVPASAVLFIVELCGMLWAKFAKIKFDYANGFKISLAIFTLFAIAFIYIIEYNLKNPDFSQERKKLIYIAFWVLYSLEAMSFAIMELLDRGTINNFLCFVFAFTFIPIFEPTTKTIVLMIAFLTEEGVMHKLGSADPDSILLCFFSVLIASIASFVTFFRYMNTKIKEKRLENFANVDQLTLLTNRRGFAGVAPELKQHCENQGLKLSVIMADIDDFKTYNDTFGHIEGDICLRNVATKIKENFSRPSDICTRYGGEEFVVISAGVDEERLIEHIKSFLADIESMSSSEKQRVTLSVGVCISASPEKIELDELIKIADSELYNAKTSGKNCLSYKGKIYRN